MQLTKGAGALELLGMQKVSNARGYTLFKPLLELSKDQLQKYLDMHNKKYFIDESNIDPSFKRNYFRHNFSNALIKEYHEGINRSFTYLNEDRNYLLKDINILKIKELTVIKASNSRSKIFHIDKELKLRGYILSFSQRQELQNTPSLVIADRFVIEQDDHFAYIAPLTHTKMEKVFKEACRSRKIPAKIRPYLFKSAIELDEFTIKISEL